MANQEQVEILKQGVDVWNKWREENPNARIDLRGIDLSANIVIELSSIHLQEVNLSKVNLNTADLRGANLRRIILESVNLSRSNLGQANLAEAILREADLSEAYLHGVDFRGADLSAANLIRADLRTADLYATNMRGANLRYADLRGAKLLKANLSNADIRDTKLGTALLIQTVVDNAKISGSSTYGISVWDLEGEFEEQRDLVITQGGKPVITVDNIEIAQFLYLILNNEKIRDVINILTAKSVLILGRFSIPERKAILDALKNKLREYNLLPIVFDFDRPTDKDFTETIKTLAGLCYFVIADVTNPKSSPLELQATVPDYQIPFVPIIQEGESPFAMMVDLQKKYNWVLNTVTYDSMETLIKVLKPLIIDPAMKKRQELRIIKAQEPETISGKDYLDKGKV